MRWLKTLILGAAATSSSLATANTPEPFGFKCAWIVVRSSSSQEVMKALPLKQKGEVTWSAGIAQAYENGYFVTPSVSGWVGIVASSLMKDEKQAARLASELSVKFGEAQFFFTHRVVEESKRGRDLTIDGLAVG